MKTLREIDLTKERAAFDDLQQMQRKLREKAQELEVLIDNKAREYYGEGGRSGYQKANSRTFTTEDGYTVKIDDYRISIGKQVSTGTIEGSGTAYDNDRGLSFYLRLNNGRRGDGYANKYEAERNRMRELQEAEKIANPFREFEDSHLLSTFNCKHMH